MYDNEGVLILRQEGTTLAKVKTESRPKRWANAALALRNATEAAREAMQAVNDALADCENIRSEYEEWKDSLPENLEYSAVGEKLQAVVDIDFSCENDLEAAESACEEMENADLPMGFGRD